MDNREKTLSAIDELDNIAFFNSDCTIIFHLGINDEGERYVDAEIVKGLVNTFDYKDFGIAYNTEDLAEAI